MSKEASPKGESNVIGFPLPADSAEPPAVGTTDERSPPRRDPGTAGRGSGGIAGRHPAEWRPPDWDGAVGDHYAVGPRENGYAVWLLDQPDEPVLWFPPHRQLGAFLAFQDLESQERRLFRRSRSYFGRRPLLVVLAALVVLLGATSGLQFALRDASVRSTHGDATANGSAGDTPAGRPSTTVTENRQQGAIRPGPGVYANGRAGYAFSYPRGWGLLGSGTAVRLVGPNGEAAISFRPASDGPVGQASTALLESLSAEYRDLQLQTPELQRTEQGFPSVVVGARATGRDGRDVRFVSITIQGAANNWAIVVRFAEGSDVLRFMPAVRQIVDSFRLTEA
jgi:hypothetical protein